MHIRRLLVLPALMAAFTLGACEAEEAEVEPVVEPVVAPAEVEVVPAAPVVDNEIPGNGIDDDGDGLIDEAV